MVMQVSKEAEREETEEREEECCTLACNWLSLTKSPFAFLEIEDTPVVGSMTESLPPAAIDFSVACEMHAPVITH